MGGYGSGLPKVKLTEFSGDPLDWPEWADLFNVLAHQMNITDIEKMQFLKRSVTGAAKEAIAGLGFSSQAYYQAWDVPCNESGEPSIIIHNPTNLQSSTCQT